MFDRFVFSCYGRKNSDGSVSSLFKCSDLSKYSFIGTMQIYVGTWYSGILSVPENCSSFEGYTHFTIELLAPKGKVLLMENFLIEEALKQKLYKYNTLQTMTGYCRFDLIPVSLLEELYNELYTASSNQLEIKKQEVKTGGNCCVCGGYDKYAPETNGKFFCYLHFKM